MLKARRARGQHAKIKPKKIKPMGFDRQQELIRFEFAIKRAMTWNESRVLAALCLFREVARHVTTTHLVVHTGLTKSQVLKAISRLRARWLVHTNMGYGGYEGEHSLRRAAKP